MDENDELAELKKFEKMMARWGFETSESLKSKKWTITLNQLLANWCSEKFANPLKAVEALRNGENLKEAAASLFWYCYSSLDEFSGEKRSLVFSNLIKQPDVDGINKGFETIKGFKSQLIEISHNFTLEDIKYPTGSDSYVKVTVGAALIILLAQEMKWHKDTQNLLERVYGYIGHIPVGDPGYEMEIGIAQVEIETTNDGYTLTGVPYYLSMLACITTWDSYANLLLKQKDYRGSFANVIKLLGFCCELLSGSDVGEVECESVYLPYSGIRSQDMDYINKIIGIWELVKKTTHKTEDWEEMLSYLHTLDGVLKQQYFNRKVTTGGVVVEIGDNEASEIGDYISKELSICRFAIENPGSANYIYDANKQVRERTILKYFFPKGLHNHFENGTLKCVMSAEDAWWNNDFDTMADKMRQAMEVETIATIPILKFTRNKKDKRTLATRIADAIANNEENAMASIDSIPDIISGYSKKQLKTKLPGFIKKVVDVRNFFMKEAYLPGTSFEKRKQYRVKAEETHSEFFGIGCSGMLPFLIRCKKDIKTAK